MLLFGAVNNDSLNHAIDLTVKNFTKKAKSNIQLTDFYWALPF